MRHILTILGLLTVLATLSGCNVDQETAERVLADEGYHEVELTGWAPLSCSQGDAFKSGFRARRTVLNPNGTTSERVVVGTICCGWFKACTVRH
jgi:hypothetical protein